MIPKRSRRPSDPLRELSAIQRAILVDASLGLLLWIGPNTFRPAFNVGDGPRYPVPFVRALVARRLLEWEGGKPDVAQITGKGRALARIIKRNSAALERLKRGLR